MNCKVRFKTNFTMYDALLDIFLTKKSYVSKYIILYNQNYYKYIILYNQNYT